MAAFAPGALRTVLDGLLDELDLLAEQAQVDGPAAAKDTYWTCQRQHTRHPFRCDCTVRFFASPARDIGVLPARTRNLSRSGLGVLVKRPFTTGDVLEIQLGRRPAKAPTFLAGNVRFCRYAGRGHYEVGVALKAAGEAPVFSADPVQAAQRYAWIRTAQCPE